MRPELDYHTQFDVAQWPYQIIAPERGRAAGSTTYGESKLRERFGSLIPAKPYCANWPRDGVQIRAKEAALKKRHIQLNSPQIFTWLPFDIDRPTALFAHEDAYLPRPNFVAVNPQNGHALSAYLLKTPVQNFASSHSSPLHFMSAVERGLKRRLGADPNYAGMLAKNPLHADWRVEWHDEPYALADLESWLFERDMAPEPAVKERTGAGRNCTVFDDVRGICYREIRQIKRDGASFEQWQARCIALATGSNTQFLRPMSLSEVRATGKSIAKWTWRKFSDEGFSRRQSFLGSRGAQKRWANHTAIEKSKPWVAQGISRRTWYRRKAAPIPQVAAC